MPPGKRLSIVVQSRFSPRALPPVVDLHQAGAVVLQVLRDPARVALHLVLADLLIIKIPRAPTGGRQRETRLVQRLEILYAQRLLVVVRLDGAVLQTHLLPRGVERP